MALTKITQSAGGVVINEDGEVLVVCQNGNSWSLPKGHIEQGESAIEAARREINEESGIAELLFIKKLLTYTRPRIGLSGGDDLSESKEITLFLFKTTEKALSPKDPKNPEARWVAKTEVARLLTHPKDQEVFQKILKDREIS